MEIIKNQLFKSLNKVGYDPIFVELSVKQKYRNVLKKSNKKEKDEEMKEQEEEEEELEEEEGMEKDNFEIVKFNFKEFFEWLPNKDYEELFQLLKENKFIPLFEEELLTPTAKDEMEIIDEASVKLQQKLLFNSLNTYSGIISIVYNFLTTIMNQQNNNQIFSESLFSLLTMMHETLLPILKIGENIVEEENSTIFSKEVNLKLQKFYFSIGNEISQCFELWIKNKKPQYHELVPQTISYLLFKSFTSGIVADISRLNKVRHGLLTLDYKDEGIVTFLETLLSCFTFPQYVKSDEGKKFLTFLFSINTGLIEQIHVTVKSQLLNAKKSVRDSYAEIYFKAWKSAQQHNQNQIVLKIEYFCIQNLINTAIHVGDQKLSKCLFGFLHYFHNQKPYKDVDPMLLRLYEPILFRSLKAPNAVVRTNATRLFIDAFPLKDSNDAAQEDTDELLTKQFQILHELLFDPAVLVRVAAVEGTFILLSKFWELIPLVTSRSLLSKLLNDLAFDKSSGQVREHVFKGIRFLLDNSLSHSTLKILLPNLKNLIHDSSDRVRESFMDLLLFIKGISTIRFFDIVSVDHILERMVTDYKNQNLSKKYTQLIVELYFPPDSKKWDQLNNCISFIKKRKPASFTFYSNLINFQSPLQIAKFACSLFDYVVKFTNKRAASEIPLKIESTKKIQDDDEESEQVVEISVEDIEALLEIISLVLQSLLPLFAKEEFQKVKSSMLTIFNDENLSTIYCWFFQDIIVPDGASTIMKIVSYFSLENFPTLKEILLQNFQETDSTSANVLQENLLQSLFSQDTQKNTLDILINNINLPLLKLTQQTQQKDDEENEEEEEEEEEGSTTGNKRKRNNNKKNSKKKQEKIADIVENEEDEENNFEKICEKTLVSIAQLDFLFKNQNTRNKILGEADSFAELFQVLIGYMPIIKEKMLLECNISKDQLKEQQQKKENSKDEENEENNETKEDIENEENNETKEDIEQDEQVINKFYLKRLPKNLLISCFTIYIKTMYHSEVYNKELEQDSGYFDDILEFCSKQVLPLLKLYLKDYKTTNKRTRSNEIIDSDNEDPEEEEKEGIDSYRIKSDKPFILEILEIYLFVMTENVTFGLCSSQTCLQYKDEIIRILQLTKGIDICKGVIPIVSKFIYQIYNFSFIGYSELSVKSYELLKLLFEYIDNNQSIKNSNNSNNNNKLFRLGDYLSLHHQKGQLDTIVKWLIQDCLFKEFPKHLNLQPEKDEHLDILDDPKKLLPSNQLILNYLSKNHHCITQISNHLNSFIHSQSMNQNSIYFTLNLISLLINNNNSNGGVNNNNNLINSRIDISPLQSILIDFVSKLPSFVYTNEEDDEEDDDDDETLKQLKNKTISKIKYSNLLSISNDLLNITTKEKVIEKQSNKNNNNNNNSNSKDKIVKDKKDKTKKKIN